MNYGNQRCLSRITTDLGKTGNREFMNDSFRFTLEDATLDRGMPEKRIAIKAYDIDYAANFNDHMT